MGRRERAGARQVCGSSAGYALVDALVALLILSMTFILSLSAAQQARAAADMALEIRRAHSLLTHLVETAPRSYAAAGGVADGFVWRVETRTTGGERPIEVCRRAVALTNERTRRSYQLATLETCPLDSAG